MRLVMKFGGTSVGDGRRIKDAAALVHQSAQQGHEVVVAASAMSGVTNALINAARRASEGDDQVFIAAQRTLTQQHLTAIDVAVADVTARSALHEQTLKMLDGFGNLCRSIHILGELTPRALDAVASLGERLVIPIFAQALRETGSRAEAIESTELVVTDDNYTQAEPMMDETREQSREQLLPLLKEGVVPVVTGFIGATRN